MEVGDARIWRTRVRSEATGGVWEERLALSGDIVTNLQGQIDALKENCMLNEEIKTLYKLSVNATSNDLYENIYNRIRMIMLDKALMTLTIKTQNGNPIPNLPVDNLTDENGNQIYTNEKGVATGFLSEGTILLSVSGYADLSEWSKSYTITKGETYADSIILTTRNYLRLTATQNVRFSKNVKTLSYSVTAAGGSGTTGNIGASDLHAGIGGNGGNGGQSICVDNASFNPNTVYSAQVGAGNSGAGGSSLFMGTSAMGGSGNYYDGYTNNGIGGSGGSQFLNSNKTSLPENGTKGTEYYYSSFNIKTLCGGGGGGGGGRYQGMTAPSKAYGTGGGPNGGKGGTNSGGAGSLGGIGGGSGGGGALATGAGKGTAGSGPIGGNGVIAFSMTLNVM